MNKQKVNLHFGIITVFILLAALSRLLPHPPNFTPIGGMALFGAAYFSKKYWSFLIPFAALWISDLFLNNIVYANMYPDYYTGFVWFTQGGAWIYGAFALIILLGMLTLRNIKTQNIVLSSVAASTIFFVLTNIGVWLGSGMYAKTWAGLTTCFSMAIPYFWNTLGGDLFFSAVLFGGYALVQSRFLAPQNA